MIKTPQAPRIVWFMRICIPLMFVAAIFIGSSHRQLPSPYQSVLIEAKQHKDVGIEAPREPAEFIGPFLITVSTSFPNGNPAAENIELKSEREQFSKEGTKVTDTLLAVFTGLLVFATLLLWRSSELAFKATERAFIHIDEIETELATGLDGNLDNVPDKYKSDPGLFISRFAIQPRWKNSGRTPPKRMTIQVNWSGPEGSLPTELAYNRSGPEPFFIAPNAVEPSGVIEITPAQALVDHGAWCGSGPEPRIFIWGRADYEDIFGKSHFTHWCYQLRFERHKLKKELRASFIQWSEYNRTDESDGRASGIMRWLASL